MVSLLNITSQLYDDFQTIQLLVHIVRGPFITFLEYLWTCDRLQKHATVEAIVYLGLLL